MRQCIRRTSPVVFAAIAGLALSSVVAQADPPREKAPRDAEARQNDRVVRGAPLIRTFSDVTGWDVINNDELQLGTIEDFVVDRGNGKVRFVVIKHDATLGFGGSSRVAYADAITWDGSRKRAVMNLSTTDMEGLPELNAMPWNTNGDGERAWTPSRHDPYGEHIAMSRDRKTVKGTITDVERRATHGEECVYVTVETNEGNSRTLVLGPTWFVMGRPSAPETGESAEFEVVTLDNSRDAWGVATRAMYGDRTFNLRDSKGDPTWADPRRSEAEYGSPRHPFVRVSEIVGAPVITNSGQAGEIHDAYVDLASDRLLFLGVDPNENFLGMADTIRVAPWNIARFTTESEIRLQATEDQITNSPKAPGDASRLNSGSFWNRVYMHFGAEPVQFGEVKRSSYGSSFEQALERGEDGRLNASFVAFRATNEFDHIDRGISTLVVRTADKTTHVFYVGPDALDDRVRSRFEPGDNVTVEYRETKLNDKTFKGVTRIHLEDGVVTIWSPKRTSSQR